MVVEGESSSVAKVTSGVPQGSILGPLLFILAFNGIFQVPLSSGTILVSYADDVTYTKDMTCDNDLSSINNDLQSLSSWISDLGLHLNLNKVKSLVISRKCHFPSAPLMINHIHIECVTSFKLLGVMVSSDHLQLF